MRSFLDRSIRTKILAGSLCAVLILLVTAVRLYQGLLVSQEREAWVTHTYQVIGDTDSLLLEWVNMQTGYRGFLLTGDQTFLEPYNAGKQAADTLQADLQRLVADNPPQVALLQRLVQAAETWRNEVTDPGVALRQAVAAGETSPAAIEAFEQTNKDKQLFDVMRQHAAEFRQIEVDLLAQRSLEAERAASDLRYTLLLGTTAALLLSLVLSVLIARNIAQRLNKVAQIASSIAGGDLAAYVDLPTGRDEVGRMTAAFTKMAETIRRQIQVVELARSESRAVLDATNEAMILVGPNLNVRTVNHCFEKLFGVEAQELVGAPLSQLEPVIQRVFTNPALVLSQVASADKAITGGGGTIIVSQMWPEQRELELFTTSVSSSDGAYLGRLCVFRNVTQERAVDRMKSEFVSMVSHELRTPLTSIKGYVSLMLDDEVGALNEDQRDFLLIVQSNADRQVSLINALLDLTRIEAGKVELQQGPLDLAAIIHMVSTSFRPQLAAKKQQLSVAIDDHLPPLVGDSDRITQVVTNLVSNAHKYTPAGGEISVSVRANTDHVLLEVRDTGIGMTAEEQNQLFNKFFRAKNRATQEATGTGLGLAITRGLVELHGGKIGVTSAPGQGTTFSVALPVSSAAVSFDIEPPEVGLVRAGGRVLVVDDEPDIAHLIQRYLERGGYRVRVAANGSEALRMAQRDQPDLILLDVLLPDVDGFTVLEWLKMEPSTAAIPVVVLSIMPNNGQGTMLGAIDYLTKPVSKDVLVDHIRRILANGPAQRVLIADDDSDVRSLLARHLKQAGFTVLEAADGAEAIEVARAHNPHLALLDVHMPGVDGVAALQVLRSEEQTRDLPVIMLSATPGTMDTRRSAIEALGSELLRKPCTAEELARMIANGVKGVIA